MSRLHAGGAAGDGAAHLRRGQRHLAAREIEQAVRRPVPPVARP